jgi:hypothetical protein
MAVVMEAMRKCGGVGGVLGRHAYMPNLYEIGLGRELEKTCDLTDDDVAFILSGSRKGWKDVEASCSVEFGRVVMCSLAKSFPTLEEFQVRGCLRIESNDLVDVLSSCPNLRILSIIETTDYRCFGIEAEGFIDEDPDTGLLNTWSCESILTTLRIWITDTPKPDLEHVRSLREDYQEEIQGLVMIALYDLRPWRRWVWDVVPMHCPRPT